MMGCAGGLLKSFVRATEDDENPYSTHNRGLPMTLAYLFFFLCVVVFLFLLTLQLDQGFPRFGGIGGWPFKTDWYSF